MNVLKMHEAVKLGLDKTSSLELPAFEPEELDYWLNEAQLQIIKQKMYGNNFRGEGFEDSGKRMDDLVTLVQESDVLSLSIHPFYPNVKTLNIEDIDSTNPDSKYMFFISAAAQFESPSNVDIDMIEAYPVMQNRIKDLIQTEFNTPFIKNPLVYFYDNKIGFIHDPYKSITAAYIKYVKQPKELVSTGATEYQTTESELPEQVHPEIVALTVNLLLENIESVRLEPNLMQLSKKE